MVHGLKPYPAMKDSGVPWLGAVPAGWAVVRGKGLFRCIDERSARGAEELLTVSSERGVVPRRTAKVTMFKAESYQGYKLCWPGDLVINSLWAWGRGLGVSPHHGIVSSAYGVYRAKGGLAVPRYIHELVRSQPFNWELQVRSKGIWISRLQLTDDSFLDAPFLLPPLTEQHLIVRFLDHADRRIRRLIAAKQRMIKLLEEQKRAIIHQAVTRGLDPNVKMKASGVGWLGDVPEHWRVMPLARVTVSRCDGPFGSGLTSAHYRDFGVRVFRLKNIGHGEFKSADEAFISETHYGTLGDHSVIAGDVVIAGLGDERHPAGRACVAPPGLGPAMVKADCFRFRLRQDVVRPTFMALHLTATAFGAAAILSTGSTRQRTNLSSTAGRHVSLPPVSEQDAILASIEEETLAIGPALRSVATEITLLREYRTRLIADVVTGKLDVREAAALLPDESAQPDAVGLDDDPSDDLDPSDEPTPDEPEP